jgi:hypothetical protein
MFAQAHSQLLKRLATPVNGVAVYGDSGAGRVVTGLAALRPAWRIENRGVGGENMSQIATRYRQDQLWRSHILVVFDLSNDEVENNNVFYPQMLADMRTAVKRWLFVQPGIAADQDTNVGIPASLIGGSFRPTIEARWQSVADAAGPNYVPILGPLQAANNGSAGDLWDVENGIVPRSLRDPGDSLHLTQVGSDVVAAQVVAAIEARGWL